MKANGNGSWSLFRLSDRKQFDRVDLATIDFFYRALPEALYTDWLMWREGFSGWRPFSELPLILKHLSKHEEEIQAPPVPEAILKIADEVTSHGQQGTLPTVEGEAKFEISKASQSQPSLELKTKTSHNKVRPDTGVVTSGFGAPANTGSRPIAQNTTGFVVPESDTGIQAAEESENAALENTHSSVSIRALQAAATSSLRLKTVGRGLNVGGAAGTKSNRDGESPVETGGLRPAGRVLTMPDEATMSLMLESEAASEDRNNVRYTKKFKVRIFTPKGIVAVSTIDCSVSGFKLRDPLPEGLPRFFHCEIDLGPEGKIPLICSEVKEKDGRAATRVRIQVNDHLQTFKSALMRAS
ncbi:MAG: PilZ domain-containing protein [Bdellovibrionales bacterium]|nr:PilZ domain-containing protein [Bdellovibrionales bacterium]